MGGRLRGRGVWSGDSSEETDSWGEVWVLVFLVTLCFSVINKKLRNKAVIQLKKQYITCAKLMFKNHL